MTFPENPFGFRDSGKGSDFKKRPHATRRWLRRTASPIHSPFAFLHILRASALKSKPPDTHRSPLDNVRQ